MNLEQFDQQFGHLKDLDKIEVDPLCDHPEHKNDGKMIGRGPARRNILKNGGNQFICRTCFMKYKNPMQTLGKIEKRQKDEIINVVCPTCEKERKMKSVCYYGEMKQPYQQVCKTCAQKGKVISEEQKQAISEKLTGRHLSDSHKRNIGKAIKSDPERLRKAIANLIPGQGGRARAGQPLPEEWRASISKGTRGKPKTKKHRKNISKGRKKMLAEQGGFTKGTREKIGKSVVQQYQQGFDPHTHHMRGWHFSDKLNAKIWYRSSYEKKAYMILDDDTTVDYYKVEAVKVGYHNPEKDIESTYLIDIRVVYKSGKIFLVEVKPRKWLENPVIEAKVAAAQAEVEKLGITFEVWDEYKLFGEKNPLKKAQEFVEWLRTQDSDIESPPGLDIDTE